MGFSLLVKNFPGGSALDYDLLTAVMQKVPFFQKYFPSPVRQAGQSVCPFGKKRI
jgi:hypothetical protein